MKGVDLPAGRAVARVPSPGPGAEPASGRPAPGAGAGAGVDPAAAGRAVPLLDAGRVALLVLVEIAPHARLWGWARFVVQRERLRRDPAVRFAKMLGSGHEGGFGLRPSGTRQGLFLGFDDEAAARDFIARSPVLAGYRSHARELCLVLLRACSSKGSWDGAALQTSVAEPASGPIAALTRASIRPRHLLAFWRHAPPSQRDLENAAGCRLAVGLGEAPLLRQCTFSLWDDAAAMQAYARSGAHLQAIRAAYGGGFFSETMFVRFVPLEVFGQWRGRRHG